MQKSPEDFRIPNPRQIAPRLCSLSFYERKFFLVKLHFLKKSKNLDLGSAALVVAIFGMLVYIPIKDT